MSTLKVNAIRGTGASSDAISVNSTDGTCTVKATNRSSNLIINGAMNVAQYGSSSGGSGFKTVDRFAFYGTGLNAAVTISQADVASGTTPYNLGFRKSHKITNGAQTGPDAGDYIYFSHKIEAQDMATSGWNYTSASSYITLSFWVKSSVAQNFYGYLKTSDGTSQNYPFETGSLSADTWTKITKKIPGHANIQFDIDTETGVEFVIAAFFGTDTTGTLSLNAWGSWSSSNRLPNNTSTWFTTDGATFEYTGVQLEVGDFASDYSHEPYSETLRKCQRYYQEIHGGYGGGASSSEIVYCTTYPVKMRATPSVSQTAAMTFEEPADADRNQSSTSAGIRSSRCSDTGCVVTLGNYSDIAKDQLYFSSCNQNSGGKVTYSAEL